MSRKRSSLELLPLLVLLVLGLVCVVIAGGVLLFTTTPPSTAGGAPPQPTTGAISNPTPPINPTSDPAVVPPTAAPAPPPAVINPGSGSVVDAVARVRPATVTVVTRGPGGGGSGSGFFISPEGFVVTNNHVVEGGSQFAIVYASGDSAFAELHGTAPEFDLAVLRVNGTVPATAQWGDSINIPLGAPVIAIGSALGEYQHSVTQGILSGYNRSLGNLRGLLQTDAAINRGNSGGPLLNAAGEVIGINTLVVRGGESLAEGLGFAIPSNLARPVVEQLIRNRAVQRPFIGVQFDMITPLMALEEGLGNTQGALIQDVVPNSPSALAGIQPNDIIISVNSLALDDRRTLDSQILAYNVGDTINLEILRGDQRFSVSLTLAPRSN